MEISTINSLHSDTTSTLKYGCLYYNLQLNIAELVGPVYLDRDDINSFATVEDMKKISREESLSPEDWIKISTILEEHIKNAKTEEDFWLSIKDLLFMTCEYILMMRIGEVQGLPYKNILFDQNMIFLNQAWSKDAKAITPLKTRKVRFVYPTENILKLFFKCYGHENKKEGFSENNLIFGHNGFFSRTNVLRRLHSLEKQIETEKNITNHKLRHEIISNLLYENVDPTVIAEMAGHDKKMTVDNYNQSLEKAKKNLIKHLEKIYVPNIKI